MSRKKSKKSQEDTNGASVIQGVENTEGDQKAEEKPRIRKVGIEIKKFYGKVMPETLHDLEELCNLARTSMKSALCFFADLGSLMYRQMKKEALERTQPKNKEKKNGEQTEAKG